MFNREWNREEFDHYQEETQYVLPANEHYHNRERTKDLVAIGKKLIAHEIKKDVTAIQREPDNNYANAWSRLSSLNINRD